MWADKFLLHGIEFCVLSCQWVVAIHHKLTIKKKKKKFVMSIAIHHKINYKNLFDSMLGNSYSREK